MEIIIFQLYTFNVKGIGTLCINDSTYYTVQYERGSNIASCIYFRYWRLMALIVRHRRLVLCICMT